MRSDRRASRLGGLRRGGGGGLVFLLLGLLYTPALTDIIVGGDLGEVSPTDPTTWTNSTTAYIGLNSGRTGVLTVDGGSGVLSNYGRLGYNPGSTGTATVTGAGSNWAIGATYLGVGGTGSLRVESGGKVGGGTGVIMGAGDGSSGFLTVTGTGSTLTAQMLYVGLSGSGNLRIENGGQANFTNASWVGYYANSSGSLTVNGSGSKLTIAGIQIGRVGSHGTLTVEAGGKVTGNYMYIEGLGNSATVTGPGSQWTSNVDFFVGDKGGGQLTVTDGGQVTAKSLYASQGDLYGNGTITAKGAVLDAELLFDSTNGFTKAFAFGAGGILNVTFDGTGTLGAGFKGSGTLRIADGVKVASNSGWLGYCAGSNGTAIVTGANSKWTSSDGVCVGKSGTATMSIEAGGQVSSNSGNIGVDAGSNGTVQVSGAGSKWTITEGLGVGSSGTAVMSVLGGGKVTSGGGNIGYASGSTGTVTVSGTGSSWSASPTLNVGPHGAGKVKIQAGGQLFSSTGWLGQFSGSTGSVIVTGSGSAWTNAYDINVGFYGPGKLTVTDGGKVTARLIDIRSSLSVLTIGVTGNNMIVLGDGVYTGSITNKSTVNLFADPFLGAGTYSPISDVRGREMTWSGSGSYNALGGTWDNVAKTFAVTPTVALTAGSPATVTSAERLLITDPATGKKMGASFGTVPGGTTFSAEPAGSSELHKLELRGGYEGPVLAAWDFDTNFAGGEVLLSFYIGPGQPDPLGVWHYDGNSWTPYYADDMYYNSTNGMVSFTVDGFSDYAVTQGVAPEPATLALLALGGGGVIGRLALRRRRC